jgi:hypothetical protein
LLACVRLAVGALLALPLGGCGTDCSAEARREACSDSGHYLSCSGGEGYFHDVAEACPAAKPLCIERNQSHSCVTADERDCTVRYPDVIGSNVLHPGDVNGDGLTDVVYQHGDEVGTLLGQAAGDFAVTSSLVGGVVDARLVDLTRDGVLDLLLVERAGQLLLMAGVGDATFDVATPQPLFDGAQVILGLGDVDADAQPDVLLLDDRERVVMLEGATAIEPVVLELGLPRRPLQVDVLDANADGLPELLVGDQDARAELHYLDGDTWLAGQAFGGTVVAVGDLDGDGVADLVIDDAIEGRANLEIGQGDRSFARRESVAGRAIVVADLNGVGGLDMILGRDAELVRLDGAGDGSFQPAQPLGLDLMAESTAVLTTSAGTELLIQPVNGPLQRLIADCLSRP